MLCRAKRTASAGHLLLLMDRRGHLLCMNTSGWWVLPTLPECLIVQICGFESRLGTVKGWE